MKLLTRVFYALILLTLWLGCATTKAATTDIKTCAPPTADFSALVLQAVDGAETVSNAVTEAEVLAAETAICTVTQIAKDVLKAATGIQLATSGPPAMRQQWAAAWVKAHP